VTNWGEYDAVLRQRGSLTVWFIGEAIEAWQAAPPIITMPGGKSKLSLPKSDSSIPMM
jgi:hypothetical protein